jgi:predicted acyltransferase
MEVEEKEKMAGNNRNVMPGQNRAQLTPTGGQDRFQALDVYRGCVMFLLLGDKLFALLASPSFPAWGHVLAYAFRHGPWIGLRAWDLIQPSFMFMAGAAIPFAVHAHQKAGRPRAVLVRHVLWRAFVLLLLGWLIDSVYSPPHCLCGRFQNVLAQLGFTYPVAFALTALPLWGQGAASLVFPVLSDVLYRTFPVAGYDSPFTPDDRNFGTFVDSLIGGVRSGHWVSFNAVPTAAHTIWGAMAGQVLLSSTRSPTWRLAVLLASSASLFLSGILYSLYTPIIKRIATMSFVFVSGAFCFLFLSFFYWLVDLERVPGSRLHFTALPRDAPWRKSGFFVFFTIVGINSLAVYLFDKLGAMELLGGLLSPVTQFLPFGADDLWVLVLCRLFSWAAAYFLCYLLWKRNIVVKL